MCGTSCSTRPAPAGGSAGGPGPSSGAGACRSRRATTTSCPAPTFRDHVGDAWYQRTVHVPAGWDGRRIVLRVDAATHRGTVFVDDVEVVSHEGGYTPFEVDVTALVTPGSPAG